MPTASASAPGKLILFGEHSVVYGYAAVAAALSELRVTVHIASTTDGHLSAELCDLLSSAPGGGTVRLQMPMEKLRSSLADCDGLDDWRVSSPPSEATIGACRRALGEMNAADAEKLLPLVFLCRALLPELLHAVDNSGTKRQKLTPGADSTAGLRISVRSAALPLGAGLGSSAAFSVALAGALVRLRLRLFADADGSAALVAAAPVRIAGSAVAAEPGAPVNAAPLPPCRGAEVDARCPGEEAKTLINGWAYAAECILHGTPSGLDNEVSCAGDAVRHVRAGAAKRFEVVRGLPQLRVLITNTKVARSTREKVAGVAALRAAQPEAIQHIFASIASIADRFLALARPPAAASSASSSGGGDGGGKGGQAAACNGSAESSTSSDELTTIGTLVRMNHHLLCAIGVGAPALDEVVSITAEEHLPTKLTGAGGGGCAYTVLGLAECTPSEPAAAAARRARAKLEAKGFECFETRVGGHGCLWHD